MEKHSTSPHHEHALSLPSQEYLPPPNSLVALGREAVDMTLLDGSRRVAARHEMKKALRRKAEDRARLLFEEAGEGGIPEGKLVDAVLKAFPEIGPETAFSVVDDLRARGLAAKDWKTGELKPVK